ncbi:MAG: nitroreductase family protein [Methanomassiliicoccales archaeon]|nr:nitroreductase family protein [Methanomassiliicoccales archaeon]
MDVEDAIHARRALRAYDMRPVENEKASALIEAMRLAPSCNNNQPWRVVVCRDPESLAKAKMALSKGNVWGTAAPLIFVVSARLEDDCHPSDRRDYFLFGCGLAVGQLCLLAVELGLIAHPVAGYDPLVHKRELGIPEEYVVITTIMIGYPGTDQSLLSDKQKTQQLERPERKPVVENFFEGKWGVPFQG